MGTKYALINFFFLIPKYALICSYMNVDNVKSHPIKQPNLPHRGPVVENWQ